MSQPKLFCMGNPLLDICSHVSQDVLDKYGLEHGTVVLAEEKHVPLFAELEAHADCKYIAGGSTMNSARVAEWMLQQPASVAYMGSVGPDAHAATLKAECNKAQVLSQFEVIENERTGVCGTLLVDKERTLVPDLQAAVKYNVRHLQANSEWMRSAAVLYNDGFFATTSPASMVMMADEAVARGKPYCLNLSAQFIMQVLPFREAMLAVFPSVSVLFGNETEAKCFADVMNFSDGEGASVAKIAETIQKKYLPLAGSKVVITQGADDTIIATAEGLTQYPIVKLPPEDVVDTNGAGDAYVAGFLAGMVRGLGDAKCAAAGAYAASVIVQADGCTFDNCTPYKWD